MKEIVLIIVFIFSSLCSFAQIEPNDANALMGLPRATDLAEINAILSPQIGAVVFNDDDGEIYRYTGAPNNWVKATDDQNSNEVNTVASTIDLNGDTVVDATDIIDTDGDGTAETNSQEVFEAITPITSKAGRVFYPPSIEIDVSTLTAAAAADETIDLYQQYTNQYDISVNTTTINGIVVNYQTAKSTSAPNNIPLYTANELYYYVTFADASVFSITGITDTGILSYRVVGQPTDFNTLINVVFVVK